MRIFETLNINKKTDICNSTTNYQSNISFKAAPISPQKAREINSKIIKTGAKTIDIFLHASPDEDTLNAGKVIGNYCKRHGIEPNFCVSKPKLKGLYVGHGRLNVKTDKIPADATIILDHSAKSKMSIMNADVYEKTNADNIFIMDHHLEPQDKKDNLKGTIYRDKTAYSCCGVVYRFFEGLGEKLNKKDFKSLYCGVLSDYQKSKLVKFEDGKLIKLPKLDEDSNSKEVLERIETQLTDTAKIKVYKHLDVMSSLSPAEKAFREKMFSKIKVTENGKLAYAIIDSNDKEWLSLGMKNSRTSSILRDFRLRVLNGFQEDNSFTPEQKKEFKNLKGAIVFYRAGNVYQMSLTTKNDYADRLVGYIKTVNPDLIAGGHENRMGGRIFSLDQKEIEKFINDFLSATDKVD